MGIIAAVILWSASVKVVITVPLTNTVVRVEATMVDTAPVEVAAPILLVLLLKIDAESIDIICMVPLIVITSVVVLTDVVVSTPDSAVLVLTVATEEDMTGLNLLVVSMAEDVKVVIAMMLAIIVLLPLVETVLGEDITMLSMLIDCSAAVDKL